MKLRSTKLSIASISAFLWVVPSIALADMSASISQGLGQAGEAAGYPDAISLPQIIGGLITVLLSVTGLIFLILIIYAGLLYLTSQGEAEKVKKAKNILTQSVIGLVIIIAAYAISAFVIEQLGNVTTGQTTPAPTI